MATFLVTDPQTGVKLRLTGDSPPNEQELEQIFAQQGQQPTTPTTTVAPDAAADPSIVQDINEAFSKIPGAPELSEFAAGVNRSVLGAIDLLGTDTINAILSVSGSEKRLPSLVETVPGAQGGFVEEGLKRDIIRAAGETVPAAASIGSLLKTFAQRLPAIAPALESTSAGLLRQAGQTTVASEVGLGITAGAGQAFGKEIGGEEGALIGSVLAPLTVAGGVQLVKGLTNITAKGVSALTQNLDNFSEEGASKLLAEAMVREGLTPEQITQNLAKLGPNAIPADAGINFSRLLRNASNQIPRIEGRAADVLSARQAGQSDRIIDAFDDASGTSSLSVDDEIERLNTVLKPQINNLYQQVREQPINLSKSLDALLKGDNSVGRAAKSAQAALKDIRALGERPGNIDLIDETKKVLDDQISTSIRTGKTNRARRLVRLKNRMVDEADKAIPVYKEARNLFAGKAQLESAAEIGESFLKLKSRDVVNFTKTMGDSELKMFKLGAKQAVIDKANDLQVNADAVKRMFGKKGDVQKLKSQFSNEESFNRFEEALRREAQFILTRRAAQANSTTTKQIADAGNAAEVLGTARSMLESPVAAANRFGQILGGFSNRKQGEAFARALERAGDILLESGMEPNKLQNLLREGNREAIEAALRGAFNRASQSRVVIPTAQAATAAALANSQ